MLQCQTEFNIMLLLRAWMNLPYGIYGGSTQMFTFHLCWWNHRFQV